MGNKNYIGELLGSGGNQITGFGLGGKKTIGEPFTVH